jgi:hypothetical protein
MAPKSDYIGKWVEYLDQKLQIHHGKIRKFAGSDVSVMSPSKQRHRIPISSIRRVYNRRNKAYEPFEITNSSQ